ncbi:MAG TPA: HAMP domain-containing sensor histidine kinase, partial [Gemmatimonadaceae bacterium]|nr:HAMP domain-containing sensor histidine kinase [Gemmatimonadaceae bacterium]
QARALDIERHEIGPRAEFRTTDTALTAALDALASGVLLVGPNWRIIHGNPVAARQLGLPLADFRGADLRSVCPTLAAERGGEGAPATLTDGVMRRFVAEVCTFGATIGVDVQVARDATGRLVFELGSGEVPDREPAVDDRGEENATLRILARQMAAVADSQQLLTVLCEAAWAQCHGSGAAVVAVEGEGGRIAVGVGTMHEVEGRRFPLQGSLSDQAIEVRGPIRIEHVERSTAQLAPELAQLGIGSMLLAPLLAHADVLGVLIVVRPTDASAFAARDLQRIQVIADHASLALWKSQLLERAQAADSAKGRFLATMSHELRTPLTALTGYGELLADQVIGPLTEPQLDILERMRSVTHHLATMIEEVLAYSSLESNAESVRPTEFLAADLVQSVAAVIDPIARQKGLELQTDAMAAPVRVVGDVDKIRQILVNLAGNAVKFTDEGSVRLSARERGHEVGFEIVDTGVGISAADMPRLFRPFTQLDTGLTRRHGGTGLGLYISQRLAALLGGRIEVESEAGVGSRFELVVPRAPRAS